MKNILNALTHIDHEISTFSQLTFYLEQRDIPFAPFQKFSMLDSWLIHFRNIYDFLRSDLNKRNKDDIFASDFFPHINWENTRIRFSEELRNEYVKINKMCAHLSYERIELVEQGKNEWHIMAMYLELADVFNHFANIYNEDVKRIYKFKIKPMPLDLEGLFAEKMEHSPLPAITLTNDLIDNRDNVMQLPDLNEVFSKLLSVKSIFDNETHTIQEWLEIRDKEVEENLELLNDYQNNRLAIFKIFVADLLMRAMKGDRGKAIKDNLDKFLRIESDLKVTDIFKKLLVNAKYRWLEQGVEVLKDVSKIFFSNSFHFKDYLDRSQNEIYNNFQSCGFLDVKFISYKVRDLALSNFSNEYVANDLHVVRILTRTGLLNYGFGLLSEEEYEMGNNPSNEKNYMFLHKLILMFAANNNLNIPPAKIDRIFWHFGRTICESKPKCNICPINDICLTGINRKDK